MQSEVRLVVCLLVLALPLGRPAAATTYLMMPDDALVDQAAAVVDGDVESASPAPPVGQPATDYLVQVRRVLKGSVSGSALMVRVPGGVDPQGLGLKIWGAPESAVWKRPLLSVRRARDGTYGTLHP